MKKPRDLGLLLWYLLHRVPVDTELTEECIRVAANHCRMSPKRLAEVRIGSLTVHWRRMLEKRGRRLGWAKENGKTPPSGWTPPVAGEQDRTTQVQAMRSWWRCEAPKRARARKHRSQKDWRFTTWLTTKMIRSQSIQDRRKRHRIANALQARSLERTVADQLSSKELDLLEVAKSGDQGEPPSRDT